MHPSAHVIHDVVLRQGEDELERPASALAWSGLAAGMSMGFSLVAEGLIHAMLPNSEWRPLISKLGYSLGFLIVIVGKQQLFTENTLTPIIPLMHHKDASTFGKVAKLWTAVFLANVLGTILVAWALADTTAFEPKIQNSFMELAREALKPSFADKVLRGIFAGWLIALLVWILGAAKSEGIAIIIILTYIVGLGRLTHVIAGSGRGVLPDVVRPDLVLGRFRRIHHSGAHWEHDRRRVARRSRESRAGQVRQIGMRLRASSRP